MINRANDRVRLAHRVSLFLAWHLTRAIDPLPEYSVDPGVLASTLWSLFGALAYPISLGAYFLLFALTPPLFLLINLTFYR